MASRGGLSALALAEITGGVLLAWSGITNASLATALRSVIRGKAPAAGTGTEPITTTATAPGSPGGTGPAPAKDLTGSGSANRALGRFMASGYGWGTGDNWSFLSTGWQEESGWSTTAANDPSDPYDNAYGIPQANPGTKMATSGGGWKTSAAVQIAWGLAYIKRTYGSPSQVPGWSANGPLPGYVGY